MPAAVVQITANRVQSAAKNTAYLAVTAQLTDEVGAGVPDATLTMTVPVGRGTFTGGGQTRNVTTNATGHSTFPAIIASATLGVFNPVVSFPALATAQGNFTTIDPLVPTSMIVFSGNNQSTPLNTLFINPLVIKVVNGVGGPVAGINVTFDAPALAGASLTWTSAADPVVRASDINGFSTSPTATANANAGTYNVTATSPGLFVRNFQLTNGGAAPVPASFPLLISEA